MIKTDEVRVHRFSVMTIVKEEPTIYVRDPVPTPQGQEFVLKTINVMGGYFGHSSSHAFR